MEKHDVAIIGAGPAGYVAAIYASRLGKKVLVIEKDLLGGTCLNKGCIPTKALLSSIEALNQIKAAPSFGIEVGSYHANPEKINKRKDEIVQRLRQGIEALFKARAITLLKGAARLVDPDTIDCAGQLVKAKDIIIATGSRPQETPALKFDHKNILSSDDILALKEVPGSLVIIGGGAIGAEFATIYNGLGCKVTIIEMMDEILPNVDKEMAKRLNLILKKKGVTILTGVKVEKLEAASDKVRIVLSSGKEQAFDKALVCVGRAPNSESIGIEKLGIKTKDAKILTDGSMRTNIGNIYAIGDVVGRFQLAHVASYEGQIACENICGNKKGADYKSVPNCVYTDPEIASAGLSEEAALAQGLDIKITRFPFAGLGKAHAAGKAEGLVKMIGEKSSGRIIGVHILGADATNLIAEAVLAIKQGITAAQLSQTIHAHPTFSEALMEACHIFEERGIHAI